MRRRSNWIALITMRLRNSGKLVITDRSQRVILEPGDFYILASRERVRVPPEFAAEMVPFDPSVGEFRIHYAGFFDPGFGYGSSDIKGTRAVLEVRAHEVPFLIEHEQFVGTADLHAAVVEAGKDLWRCRLARRISSRRSP